MVHKSCSSYSKCNLVICVINAERKKRTTTHSSLDHFFQRVESEVFQSCLTLCDPMDYRLPGSSMHRIFQASVLEWAAISFSRGSSWPRDWTLVSHTAGTPFTVWATREADRMNPARNQNCVINVQDECNCSVPVVSYWWQSFNSTISHLLSLLQSVAHLACSLHASPWMPAAVLYFSRSCTIRLNIFSLFFVHVSFYVLFAWKI